MGHLKRMSRKVVSTDENKIKKKQKAKKEQILICIIILMVPLFSFSSMIEIIEIKASEVLFLSLDCIKEC